MHIFHIDKFEVDIYPFFVLNKICKYVFIALLRYIDFITNIAFKLGE